LRKPSAASGRVVDPVADHRHLQSLRLEPGDDGRLAGRKGARDHLLDSRGGRDGPGGGLVVPGEQDRAEPEPAQLGDGGGRRRLDRVGDRDGAADPSQPASTVV